MSETLKDMLAEERFSPQEQMINFASGAFYEKFVTKFGTEKAMDVGGDLILKQMFAANKELMDRVEPKDNKLDISTDGSMGSTILLLPDNNRGDCDELERTENY